MKETKEVLLALLKVLPIIVADFKDGVQITDAVDIYSKITSNADLKKLIEDAFANYKQIPEELKVAATADYVKLIAEVLPELLNTIDSLKA